MANKYLRRWRPGLLFFSNQSAHVGPNSKPLQRLLHAPASSHARSRHTCFPLQRYPSAGEDDDPNVKVINEDKRQLARSHSCSKLRLVPSSLKSLLHRPPHHLHHHHDRSQTSIPQDNTPLKYTRSWSSPSLHIDKPHKMSTSNNVVQESSNSKRPPKGHVAVYVNGTQRFVVPVPYLSHPDFQALLRKAESEFGFRQKGGLVIPCSLSEFQHALSRIHQEKDPHTLLNTRLKS